MLLFGIRNWLPLKEPARSFEQSRQIILGDPCVGMRVAATNRGLGSDVGAVLDEPKRTPTVQCSYFAARSVCRPLLFVVARGEPIGHDALFINCCLTQRTT